MQVEQALFVRPSPLQPQPRTPATAAGSIRQSHHARAGETVVLASERTQRRPRTGSVAAAVAAAVATGVPVPDVLNVPPCIEFPSVDAAGQAVVHSEMLVLDGREAWAPWSCRKVGPGRRRDKNSLKPMDVFAEWLLHTLAEMERGTQVAIFLKPPPDGFDNSAWPDSQLGFMQDATTLLRLILGPTCIAIQPSSKRPEVSFQDFMLSAFKVAPVGFRLTMATSDSSLQAMVRQTNASIRFSPDLLSEGNHEIVPLDEQAILIDNVPGVGKTRATRLLREFGSLRAILNAAKEGRLGKSKTAANVLATYETLERALKPNYPSRKPIVTKLGVDQAGISLLIDNVPGIGPSRGQELLTQFGSVRGVVRAAEMNMMTRKRLQASIVALADTIIEKADLLVESSSLCGGGGWNPWIAINGAGPPIPDEDRLASFRQMVAPGTAKQLSVFASRLFLPAQPPAPPIPVEEAILVAIPKLANVADSRGILSLETITKTADELSPDPQDYANLPDDTWAKVKDLSDFENSREIIIVDALGLIYRHFNALPSHLRSPVLDVQTNAIQGFATLLIGLLGRYSDELVVVVFDGCHGQPIDFRRKLDPSYKSARAPMPNALREQIPYIKEMIGAFGVPMFEVASSEADDVIGTLVTRGIEEKIRSAIYSADKDFCQLLQRDVVRIVKPGSEDSFTEESFKEQYGGLQPRQFVDYLALVGDSSDGIRGVKGIGKVTATSLLNKYGSVREILRSVDDCPQPTRQQKQLQDSRKELLNSYKLAKIQTDVDMGDFSIEDLEPSPIMTDRINELFRQLGFSVLLRRLENFLESTSRTKSECMLSIKESFTDLVRLDMPWDEPQQMDPQPPVVCSCPEELESLVSAVRPGSTIGVCLVENTSLEDSTVVLAWESGQSVLCRFAGDQELGQALAKSLERFRVCGWDLKQTYKTLLQRNNVRLTSTVFDLSVACRIINPDAPLTFAGVVQKYLSRQETFDVERPSSDNEARLVATACMVLASRVQRELEANSLDSIATHVEFPLVNVLAQMELNGLPMDRVQLVEVLKEVDGLIRQANDSAQSVVNDATSDKVIVNFNSPGQVASILYDDLGVKTGKKSTKGRQRSTNVEVLRSLIRQETSAPAVKELCPLVLKIRELIKVRGVVRRFLGLLGDGEKHIYAQFNQIGAATGRLSVSKPNLQAIPVRSVTGSRLRTAVKAAPGKVLICADYEQIELRIIAALSGDETLLASFANREDVHAAVAAKIFKVDCNDVTREQRNKAKQFNYGIPYGISAFGLSQSLGISVRDCHMFIGEYFDAFPGVKKLTEKLVEDARTSGYAETLQRRRRYLPGLNSGNNSERMTAERMAINTPIQGTQADMIKLAMIRISKLLSSLNNGAKMVLQVHDELLLEVPMGEADACVRLVREGMAEALELPNNVEVLVDIGVGDDWLDAMPH